LRFPWTDARCCRTLVDHAWLLGELKEILACAVKKDDVSTHPRPLSIFGLCIFIDGGIFVILSDTFLSNVQAMALDVAPKKLNWDLKRDMQPKLDILRKKTERAILEMIRTFSHLIACEP